MFYNYQGTQEVRVNFESIVNAGQSYNDYKGLFNREQAVAIRSGYTFPRRMDIDRRCGKLERLWDYYDGLNRYEDACFMIGEITGIDAAKLAALVMRYENRTGKICPDDLFTLYADQCHL